MNTENLDKVILIDFKGKLTANCFQFHQTVPLITNLLAPFSVKNNIVIDHNNRSKYLLSLMAMAPKMRRFGIEPPRCGEKVFYRPLSG